MSTMTKPRRRSGLLIRRLPDEEGVLVTYLPLQELVRLIGVSDSTLAKWARAGCVRSPGILASQRHVSVLDAALLKKMTVKESLALGLRRTPEDVDRINREFFEMYQERTLPTASHAREPYDDYDLAFIISCVEEGRPCEVIARALGRSYSAIRDAIFTLRAAGDLPPSHEEDADPDEWLMRASAILTPAEAAQLHAPRPH